MTKKLSLKEGAAFLGVTEFRMRAILREGLVEAEKVQEKHFQKWYVTEAELKKYQETKGRRKDGRKVYLIRLSDEQLKQLNEWIAEKEWTTTEITPRYQPKNKKS